MTALCVHTGVWNHLYLLRPESTTVNKIMFFSSYLRTTDVSLGQPVKSLEWKQCPLLWVCSNSFVHVLIDVQCSPLATWATDATATRMQVLCHRINRLFCMNVQNPTTLSHQLQQLFSEMIDKFWLLSFPRNAISAYFCPNPMLGARLVAPVSSHLAED